MFKIYEWLKYKKVPYSREFSPFKNIYCNACGALEQGGLIPTLDCISPRKEERYAFQFSGKQPPQTVFGRNFEVILVEMPHFENDKIQWSQKSIFS